MDKVTLLTASRVEPGVALNPHWPLLSQLAPALAFAVRFRNVLGSVSVFVGLHAYILAGVALTNVAWMSQILALQAYFAAKFTTIRGVAMSGRAIVGIWDTHSAQAVRKKLFYEFALFILGCGNPVILMLFWPGWLLVGGTCLALWQYWG